MKLIVELARTLVAVPEERAFMLEQVPAGWEFE
jgi:hypothetical protein